MAKYVKSPSKTRYNQCLLVVGPSSAVRMPLVCMCVCVYAITSHSMLAQLFGTYLLCGKSCAMHYKITSEAQPTVTHTRGIRLRRTDAPKSTVNAAVCLWCCATKCNYRRGTSTLLLGTHSLLLRDLSIAWHTLHMSALITPRGPRRAHHVCVCLAVGLSRRSRWISSSAL